MLLIVAFVCMQSFFWMRRGRVVLHGNASYFPRDQFNFGPKNAVWHVYLDECPDDPPEHSVFYQVEPTVIYPHTREYIVANVDKFKHAFVYEPLEGAHAGVYGGTWIDPKDYSAIDVTRKKFQVSTLVGKKLLAPGHHIRKFLWEHQDAITVPKLFFGSSQTMMEGCTLLPPERSAKIALFDTCTHSIVIENCACPNYFSEKLIDCLITKTVPIYYGCTNISDYFETDGWTFMPDEATCLDKINSVSLEDYTRYGDVIERNYSRAMTFADPHDNIRKKIEEVI